jgi:hypothetical protein
MPHIRNTLGTHVRMVRFKRERRGVDAIASRGKKEGK